MGLLNSDIAREGFMVVIHALITAPRLPVGLPRNKSRRGSYQDILLTEPTGQDGSAPAKMRKRILEGSARAEKPKKLEDETQQLHMGKAQNALRSQI